MEPKRYDVVVIGGAFSGASSALLLRRWCPQARVLVVEASECFGRKVGEATVEISSLFLHRVLGLHDLLARDHLPKHGLRFWFAADESTPLTEMTEIGPAEVPRVPAFQLDRSRLDQSLLELAEASGAEVARPAKVVSADLDWPQSVLEIDNGEGERRTVSARWVIDATGRHAFLARRLRLRRRNEELPTAAAWSRWRGVADLDGPAVLGADPLRPRLPPIAPARRLGTSHFCGYGWWMWVIPLAGGETSVGVVYDKRLAELPAADGPAERYRRFVLAQAGAKELLRDAEMIEGDFFAYSHLPYTVSRYMDRGWALVGDAASFLDPFYSPGLDHAAMSIFATTSIVRDDLLGDTATDELATRVDRHNDQFTRSYERWFEAIYRDKYELMGDAELLGASFLMDTSLYYAGIVSPPHEDLEQLAIPVYGRKIVQTAIAFRHMRFYSRRLVKLARHRRAVGTYGRRNVGMRILPPSASIGPTGGLPMFKRGLKLWLGAELRRWWPFGRRPAAAPRQEEPAVPIEAARSTEAVGAETELGDVA